MSVPATAMPVLLQAAPPGGAAAPMPAGEGVAPVFPDCSVPHPSAPVAALPMPAMPVAVAALPMPQDAVVLPDAEAMLEMLLGSEVELEVEEDTVVPASPADTSVIPAAADIQLFASTLTTPTEATVTAMPAKAGIQSAGGQGLATAAELIQLAQQGASKPGLAPEAPVAILADAASIAPPAIEFAAFVAAPDPAPEFLALPAMAPASPPAVITAALPMSVAPAHPRWAQDMAERMVWSARENLDEVEIQLHPPELGPVRMHLKLEGHELVLHVSAAQPAAREAFEHNLPRLREQLEAQGLTLVQAQVSDQPRPQDRDAQGSSAAGKDGGELAEPVDAQTLRLRRVGLLDEYA